MNMIDVILLVLIGLAVFFAIRRMWLNKKSGKLCSGCSGSCDCCGGSCRQDVRKQEGGSGAN
jgi:hypothetical protein